MLIIVAQENAVPAVQAPPAPIAPDIPQPSPISTQAPAPQTVDDLVAEYVSGTGNRDELAKQIYSLPIPRQRVLDAILTAYKSGKGVDDIISHLLYGFPESNFGTVGRWLESATKKGDNSKEKAQEAIWTALNKSVPGTPPPKDLWGQLAGQYKGLKVQEMGGGQQGKKTQVGGNKKYFAPYLLFLQNPDAPPAGARPIDVDLVDALDNGRIEEDSAIWEQYKRDIWHDKDEQGSGRVERAKRWWLDTLASPTVAAVVAALPDAERPTERGSNLKAVENMLAARNSEIDSKVDKKIKAIFKQKGGRGIPENLGIDSPRLATLYLRDNPNKAYFSMPNFLPWFAEKMKALSAAGEMPESASQPQVNLDWFNKAKVVLQRAGVDSAAWTDPKSPNFLNAEMVDPTRMGTGPQYVKYVRDAMRSRTVSVNMDYDDHGKGRPCSFTASIGDVDVAEKPSIVKAPEISEKRKLERIEPLINPAKNPDFEPMIEYVAKRLYRPENLNLDSPEGRLSKVLYEIGTMFSESMGTRPGMPSGAAKQIQQKNWENNKTTFLMLEEEGFLDHPLPFGIGEDNFPEVNEDDPMYDEDTAKTIRKQRYEMANRQFRSDMVGFLSNPKAHAEMFQDLGLTPQKAVAVMNSVRLIALANTARMATEGIGRRVVVASALPKEAGEIERVIDSLFGHGPRSMIARLIMRNGGNLDQATMKGVREAVEKNFPKEYKRIKSSMFSLVNGILSDIMGFLQAEGKNPVAIPVVQNPS
jgi:hypothetical protein